MACLQYSDPLLSTLLKHLWQRLQPWVFLGKMLKAWHTCIWGVSPILLCRFCQVLSGWMGSVVSQLFSGFSEMLDWVQVRALAGPLKDIQRLVLKPLLCWLGCVLRVIVLLESIFYLLNLYLTRQIRKKTNYFFQWRPTKRQKASCGDGGGD